MKFIFLLLLAISGQAFATSILWQTSSDVILRFDVAGSDLVFQVVGDAKSDKKLYHLNLKARAVKPLKSPSDLRPFGPSIANQQLVYGAGNYIKNVDLILEDLIKGKRHTVVKNIPWIIEPVITPEGAIYTEMADNFDGLGLKIVKFNQVDNGFSQETIVEGPIFRRQDIPPDLHNQIKNEYPEVNGKLIVFQNDENGTPNIYLKNMQNNQFQRLSPSIFYQERPHLSDRFVAWEESERGYAVSNESVIGVYELATGLITRIEFDQSFHYQVRVFDSYIIYGAKRPEAPTTPSIRVFDMDIKKEFKTHRCFPGPVYDWRATPEGLVAAQRNGNGSRLLFASWQEIRLDCPL